MLDLCASHLGKNEVAVSFTPYIRTNSSWLMNLTENENKYCRKRMGNKFYNGLGKVFLSGHNTGGHEEKQI